MRHRSLLRIATAAVLTGATLLCAATELNTANQAELEQVKGIGPQLSAQLLQARGQGGAFQGWDDMIRRLKGVGPAKAAKLSAAGLRVAGQAYTGQAAVPASSASR